jgi:hypothetical protein
VGRAVDAPVDADPARTVAVGMTSRPSREPHRHRRLPEGPDDLHADFSGLPHLYVTLVQTAVEEVATPLELIGLTQISPSASSTNM